ncbi:unnamed protein product [Lampetra fluviatilis]
MNRGAQTDGARAATLATLSGAAAPAPHKDTCNRSPGSAARDARRTSDASNELGPKAARVNGSLSLSPRVYTMHTSQCVSERERASERCKLCSWCTRARERAEIAVQRTRRVSPRSHPAADNQGLARWRWMSSERRVRSARCQLRELAVKREPGASGPESRLIAAAAIVWAQGAHRDVGNSFSPRSLSRKSFSNLSVGLPLVHEDAGTHGSMGCTHTGSEEEDEETEAEKRVRRRCHRLRVPGSHSVPGSHGGSRRLALWSQRMIGHPSSGAAETLPSGGERRSAHTSLVLDEGQRAAEEIVERFREGRQQTDGGDFVEKHADVPRSSSKTAWVPLGHSWPRGGHLGSDDSYHSGRTCAPCPCSAAQSDGAAGSLAQLPTRP